MNSSDIASYRIKEIDIVDDSDIHIKIKLVVLSDKSRKPLVIEEMRKGSLPLLRSIQAYRRGELTCKEVYTTMNECSPVIIATGAFDASKLTDETIHDIISSIYHIPNEQPYFIEYSRAQKRARSVSVDIEVNDDNIVSPYATAAHCDKPRSVKLHDVGGNTKVIDMFEHVSGNYYTGTAKSGGESLMVESRANPITGKIEIEVVNGKWFIADVTMNVLVDFEYAPTDEVTVVSPSYTAA